MKQDTILFDLLQSFLPLDEIAQNQGYQDTARKFSFRDLLCFWIASSVGGWKGFRHSEKQLRTISALPSVDHSTLSKKASEVPYSLVKEVLDRVIQCCNRSTRRSFSLPEPAFALDSTTVTVGEGRLPWARFRGEKSGVKLHVRLDLANEALAQVETSLAQVHDSAIAPKLLNTPQTVTVQDRGYVDYKRMEAMDQAGAHFVVRLRKNFVHSNWKSLRRLSTGDSPVIQDGTCFLGESRRRFRVVTFRCEKGRGFHVATNLMGVSAETIAELYRARWQVELFFRWMKQHLNVKHLFGTTMNAVYGQLLGACTAYVLLHWLYRVEKPARFHHVSMLDFTRDLWNSQLPAEWALLLFDHLRRTRMFYTYFG